MTKVTINDWKLLINDRKSMMIDKLFKRIQIKRRLNIGWSKDKMPPALCLNVMLLHIIMLVLVALCVLRIENEYMKRSNNNDKIKSISEWHENKYCSLDGSHGTDILRWFDVRWKLSRRMRWRMYRYYSCHFEVIITEIFRGKWIVSSLKNKRTIFYLVFLNPMEDEVNERYMLNFMQHFKLLCSLLNLKFNYVIFFI